VARGRMLSSKISTDAKVRDLPCATARLLFTWMIAHADSCGRLRAEPALVRSQVLPHEQDVTAKDVASWLEAMASLGLIELYEVDGGRYLHFIAWSKHQRLDRQKHSDLPPPPSEICTEQQPVETSREPVVERSGSGSGSGSESGREHEGEGDRGNSHESSKAHPQSCSCEECFSRLSQVRRVRRR
jgi:hypothetical protein